MFDLHIKYPVIRIKQFIPVLPHMPKIYRNKDLVSNGKLLISCITLPHLSGAARGAIVKRYPLLLERKATTTNIAEQYANEIIGCLTTNS